MNTRAELYLWLAQRFSAMVLALAVLVHLITIIYATRNGLTAQEIITRLDGHVGWLLFYSVFVLAVAIHAAIGLRVVVREWTAWRGRSLDYAMVVFALLLLVLGWRAAVGLF